MTPADLRKMTNEAIAKGNKKAAEEAARKQRAADRKLAMEKAKAMRVIDGIPDRAMREAEEGRDHAIVMSIKYEDYDHSSGSFVECRPDLLNGACRIVWDYCVNAKLNPTIESWHDGMGNHSGHNIVIHW
jgi:hypothetical protein